MEKSVWKNPTNIREWPACPCPHSRACSCPHAPVPTPTLSCACVPANASQLSARGCHDANVIVRASQHTCWLSRELDSTHTCQHASASCHVNVTVHVRQPTSCLCSCVPAQRPSTVGDSARGHLWPTDERAVLSIYHVYPTMRAFVPCGVHAHRMWKSSQSVDRPTAADCPCDLIAPFARKIYIKGPLLPFHSHISSSLIFRENLGKFCEKVKGDREFGFLRIVYKSPSNLSILFLLGLRKALKVSVREFLVFSRTLLNKFQIIDVWLLICLDAWN